ncbi:hypothetical protein [Olivibacter domesticus]|uniref:DoxX protein n=1 Tax=Olivibacter domesticus TaxID=407022 RepID=A0A1H7QX99_OLID1|nr:hypothetical protein [Olivibacter domesticus]SEL52314.1 hypothetical protein SAMN05661044_02754 [Olivibacter domesticus]
MGNSAINKETSWKKHEMVLFRFFFVYFILQAVPVDWKFYERLHRISWWSVDFSDIFNISRYTRQILNSPTTPDFWGINTFWDWGIMALIALVSAAVWSFIDKRREYALLYYVLRVILRYRLAIGVIAYGFIKLFPMQSPYPSLSELNTNYGDLSAWKIFSLTLGVAPSFEMFLGLVEITAGLLLLHRKTVFLASFIILCFTGNVFLSNLAYAGGEVVYSLYLIQFALFLLWYDAPRLFRLLSLEKPAYPNTFKMPYKRDWQSKARLLLKSAFVLFFVLLYGIKTYGIYKKGGYQFPLEKGELKEGFYHVSSFIYNGQNLAFSKNDHARWQDVVIEKWTTLSIKTGQQADPITSNVEVIHSRDEEKDYEFSGTTGRQYYRYQLDKSKEKLLLKTLNGDKNESFTLDINQLNDSTILLKGVNEKRDSLQVVLKQNDKKYLLEEAKKGGRRSGLVL